MIVAPASEPVLAETLRLTSCAAFAFCKNPWDKVVVPLVTEVFISCPKEKSRTILFWVKDSPPLLTT